MGDYPTMAAAEGMIGLITADSGAAPKHVAPFGGRARKLGTNPICIGMPSDLDGPVLMDMASSTVALGKIALSRNRRESIPLGWIVDRDGNPTTDPNDYFSGGAILPVGVDQGHKGYALSFMVEVFSGLLTGLGFGIDPEGRHNDGCFIAAFNLEHFRPLDEFKKDMGEFVEFIKDSPARRRLHRGFIPRRNRAPHRAAPPPGRHLRRGRHLGTDKRPDAVPRSRKLGGRPVVPTLGKCPNFPPNIPSPSEGALLG